MAYKSICISSGHSTKCQGAVGLLNEVAEATRVADRLVEELHKRGVTAPPAFHDTKSTTQDQNLSTIVKWHNGQPSHDLDISVPNAAWPGMAGEDSVNQEVSASYQPGKRLGLIVVPSGCIFYPTKAPPAVLLKVAS
jgi:hypothetical protein